MSKWNPITITAKGLTLNAKVEAGTELVFTKMSLGSGTPTDLSTATALASPQQDMTIASKSRTDTTCVIYATATNKDVRTEYKASEIGLFARDPDEGEILYAVTTDESPDIVPPGTTATVITQRIGMSITMANAANVSTVISTTGFITADDAHNIAKEEVLARLVVSKTQPTDQVNTGLWLEPLS